MQSPDWIDGKIKGSPLPTANSGTETTLCATDHKLKRLHQVDFIG